MNRFSQMFQENQSVILLAQFHAYTSMHTPNTQCSTPLLSEMMMLTGFVTAVACFLPSVLSRTPEHCKYKPESGVFNIFISTIVRDRALVSNYIK